MIVSKQPQQDIKSDVSKSNHRDLPLSSDLTIIKLPVRCISRLGLLPPLPSHSVQSADVQVSNVSSYQLLSNTPETKAAVILVPATSKPYSSELDNKSLSKLAHTKQVMSVIFFITGMLLMFNLVHS